MLREALVGRVPLDVQRPEAELRAAFAEAPLGFREEGARDVREAVFGPADRQRVQQGGRGRARARADLDRPQRAAFGQSRDRRPHGLGGHAVQRPHGGRLAVQARRSRLAAEQQVQPVGAAAEHLGERLPAAAQHAQLDRIGF